MMKCALSYPGQTDRQTDRQEAPPRLSSIHVTQQIIAIALPPNPSIGALHNPPPPPPSPQSSHPSFLFFSPGVRAKPQNPDRSSL